MSKYNIPFSILKRKSLLFIPTLQSSIDFSKKLKNECETAVINEPSVFEPRDSRTSSKQP